MDFVLNLCAQFGQFVSVQWTRYWKWANEQEP